MKIKPTEEVTLRDNKGDDDIYVKDVTIEYSQDSANDENCQFIKIFTENNGVARYINISTEKWSFADIDDLIEILQDFKKRASL